MCNKRKHRRVAAKIGEDEDKSENLSDCISSSKKDNTEQITHKHAPPSATLAHSTEQPLFYAIEDIVGRRLSLTTNEPEYYVQWSGYDGLREGTWEPREHLLPSAMKEVASVDRGHRARLQEEVDVWATRKIAEARQSVYNSGISSSNTTHTIGSVCPYVGSKRARNSDSLEPVVVMKSGESRDGASSSAVQNIAKADKIESSTASLIVTNSDHSNNIARQGLNKQSCMNNIVSSSVSDSGAGSKKWYVTEPGIPIHARESVRRQFTKGVEVTTDCLHNRNNSVKNEDTEKLLLVCDSTKKRSKSNNAVYHELLEKGYEYCDTPTSYAIGIVGASPNYEIPKENLSALQDMHYYNNNSLVAPSNHPIVGPYISTSTTTNTTNPITTLWLPLGDFGSFTSCGLHGKGSGIGGHHGNPTEAERAYLLSHTPALPASAPQADGSVRKRGGNNFLTAASKGGSAAVVKGQHLLVADILRKKRVVVMELARRYGLHMEYLCTPSSEGISIYGQEEQSKRYPLCSEHINSSDAVTDPCEAADGIYRYTQGEGDVSINDNTIRNKYKYHSSTFSSNNQQNGFSKEIKEETDASTVERDVCADMKPVVGSTSALPSISKYISVDDALEVIRRKVFGLSEQELSTVVGYSTSTTNAMTGHVIHHHNDTINRILKKAGRSELGKGGSTIGLSSPIVSPTCRSDESYISGKTDEDHPGNCNNDISLENELRHEEINKDGNKNPDDMIRRPQLSDIPFDTEAIKSSRDISNIDNNNNNIYISKNNNDNKQLPIVMYNWNLFSKKPNMAATTALSAELYTSMSSHSSSSVGLPISNNISNNSVEMLDNTDPTLITDKMIVGEEEELNNNIQINNIINNTSDNKNNINKNNHNISGSDVDEVKVQLLRRMLNWNGPNESATTTNVVLTNGDISNNISNNTGMSYGNDYTDDAKLHPSLFLHCNSAHKDTPTGTSNINSINCINNKNNNCKNKDKDKNNCYLSSSKLPSLQSLLLTTPIHGQHMGSWASHGYKIEIYTITPNHNITGGRGYGPQDVNGLLFRDGDEYNNNIDNSDNSNSDSIQYCGRGQEGSCGADVDLYKYTSDDNNNKTNNNNVMRRRVKHNSLSSGLPLGDLLPPWWDDGDYNNNINNNINNNNIVAPHKHTILHNTIDTVKLSILSPDSLEEYLASMAAVDNISLQEKYKSNIKNNSDIALLESVYLTDDEGDDTTVCENGTSVEYNNNISNISNNISNINNNNGDDNTTTSGPEKPFSNGDKTHHEYTNNNNNNKSNINTFSSLSPKPDIYKRSTPHSRPYWDRGALEEAINDTLSTSLNVLYFEHRISINNNNEEPNTEEGIVDSTRQHTNADINGHYNNNNSTNINNINIGSHVGSQVPGVSIYIKHSDVLQTMPLYLFRVLFEEELLDFLLSKAKIVF